MLHFLLDAIQPVTHGILFTLLVAAGGVIVATIMPANRPSRAAQRAEVLRLAITRPDPQKPGTNP